MAIVGGSVGKKTFLEPNITALFYALAVLVLCEKLIAVLDPQRTSYSMALFHHIISGMALCLATFAIAWKLFEVFKGNNKLTLFFNAMKSPQVQQAVDLDEKDQSFVEKSYDGMRMEAEPEGFPLIEDIGLGLIESPEDWSDIESILMKVKKLYNLQNEPLPLLARLYSLRLQKNKLTKIPSSLFIIIPSLILLDLSETDIMSLPKSLFQLTRLRTLLLRNCKSLMMLPAEVGNLKRLEVLDMEGTEIIEDLPVEIKELSLLKRLRVSLYGGCRDQNWIRMHSVMIPHGVISALSNLEEISINVNPDDERWDVACVKRILNEVCGLKRLRNLGFYFPRVELLKDLVLNGPPMIYLSLSKFRFIVGGHSTRIKSHLPRNVEFELDRRECNRYLKYINGEGIPEDIKMVLKHATAFQLDRHMTVKKLTEFGIENMEHLKGCLLGECNEIQVIIDGNDIHEEDDNSRIKCESSGDKKIGLELLEFLYVYYMNNLKSIWEGPVHKRCLYRLKSLTLSTCPQLTTIFTVGLLGNLHKLEELTVRECPAIKSLVSCEEGAKQSASYLPELRTISLHYVPNLVSISNEVCIAPKLESLSLYNCPKLKSLSIKEVSSKHLKKIIGETDWWKALELTQVQHENFDGIFIPICSLPNL